MPEPTVSQIILEELRELRGEFHEFKDKVITESSERRGKSTIITMIVSIIISFLVSFFARAKGH